MKGTSNHAVNTDAPCARLRPRRGSPVTFVRWASFRSVRAEAVIDIGIVNLP